MTKSSSSASRRADYALALLLDLLEQTPAGSKLKPERELAAQFGVSRRVLRDALDRLEAEGRITRAPGRGTVVVEMEAVTSLPCTPPDPPKVMMPVESGVGPETVLLGSSPMDLMDARLVLEPALAAVAAMRASTQDIQQMQEYLDLGRQASSPQEWEKWDSALHQRIGEATHNLLLQYFYQVLSAARSQTQWGRLRQQTLNPTKQHFYSEQHAAILQAIQARDPQQAADRMKEHLHTVKRTLIEGLEI